VLSQLGLFKFYQLIWPNLLVGIKVINFQREFVLFYCHSVLSIRNLDPIRRLEIC